MAGNKVIAIVGAGIGGIAAGIALYRAGFTVRIFERAGQLAEAGTGISLWHNGTGILNELGVLPEILKHGQIGTNFLLRTQSGKLLMNISTSEADTPTVCVHRADLLRVLAAALPPECFCLGHELAGLEITGHKACLQFNNQNSFLCDGVVGADGVHSRLRAMLAKGREPAHRGYVIFRGLADAPAGLPPGCNGETWGAGHRFGMLAIGKSLGHKLGSNVTRELGKSLDRNLDKSLDKNKVCWYATANTSGLNLPAAGRKAWLQDVFKAWHDPIPHLLATTDPAAILVTNARDLKPARQLSSGPVTLLGDAAHALTPNLGQGACVALEDALVLARCLSCQSDVSSGFRRYESLRFPHVRSAVLRSRWLGHVGQWESPIAVFLRNLVTRRLPARLFECHSTFAEHMAALTGRTLKEVAA